MTRLVSINRQLMLAGTLGLVLSACSSVSLDDKGAKGASQGGAPIQNIDTRTGALEPTPTGGVAGISAERLKAAGFSADGRASIYFGYDAVTIASEYQPLLEATARLLKENKDVRLLIEGNTDERGTEEYNIALGQRRSEAARKALSILGAQEQRVEAVSNGEEKPMALGRDEAAFAQNRRADLILK